MISLIVQVKNFTALAEPLLKSEALGFQFSTVFHRTLFAKNLLLSKNIYKKEIKEQDFEFPETQKDFGKVIELSEDFDEVRVDEQVKKRKRTKVNKLNKNLKVDFIKNEETFKCEEQKEEDEAKSKFKFVVLNKDSALLCSIMTELKSRKNREKKDEILLEGKRLIQDAIFAGAKPVKIFFSRVSDLEKLNLPKEVKMFKVPYKGFGLWGDVVTSQGVIGVFKTPKNITLMENAQSLPLTVICDNVKDPGNLGSMVRVMAGVGCKKIILTKGCTDIWEPKVLRAGAGAHFRIPIIKNILWSDIENEISEDTRVFLADFSHGASIEGFENEDAPENNINYPFKIRNPLSENLPTHCYYSLKYRNENTVIVIGGETHGLSDEAYKFALGRNGTKIFIPLNNKIESLNNSVALGILAYEVRRQFDLLGETENHCSKTDCDL